MPISVFPCNWYVSLYFPARLCASDFPSVRVFREPLIPARPRPSQQDFKHLATSHDSHHLCVTSTAGRMDLLVDEPQEARGIFFLFFLDTVGMCRISPINTFLFFLSPSVFFIFLLLLLFLCFSPLSCHSCLVYLSFSKELRDGSNQNESYLTISLLYFYLLEFYFNIRRCSEEGRKKKKSQDGWWTTLWGACFFHLSWLIVNHWFRN